MFAPIGTTSAFPQKVALVDEVGNAVYAKSKVTLTSAQILALNTTPITLISAAGAGTIIVPITYSARLNFNTTAYTGANNLELRYTNGSGTKPLADVTAAFINSAATAYYVGADGAVVAAVNAPLVAFVPTANPAAGDSTMTIEIFYQVRDITV